MGARDVKEERLPFLLSAFGDFENLISINNATKGPRKYHISGYPISDTLPSSTSTPRELPELNPKEVKYHLNRLMAGDFPWEKIDILVQEGHKGGYIDDDELWEWDQLYAFQQESFTAVAEEGLDVKHDDEVGAREALNDIVLWALACDQMWGVDGIGDILSAFNVDWLTLEFEWHHFKIGINRREVEDMTVLE
ncbi:hypothetical protein G7Y89_g5028 [Cudoniella acicularis]|uniref:Uncharacterized protein n=1 Tax=Cudoniella acicularis TaxID=354080 RepID=A0A8H4RN93_9HELO|nr:hypothetical protein G7Y89_g5028 [Cudoniella acicularis]